MKNLTIKLPVYTQKGLEPQLKIIIDLYKINNKKVNFYTNEIFHFNFSHKKQTIEQRCNFLSIVINDDTNFTDLADKLLYEYIRIEDSIDKDYRKDNCIDEYYDPQTYNPCYNEFEDNSSLLYNVPSADDPFTHSMYLLEGIIYLEILNSPHLQKKPSQYIYTKKEK